MAPFMRRHCPRCLAVTWQDFVLGDDTPQDAEEERSVICESCEMVLIHWADGTVGQGAATAEERAFLPVKPDWSEEPWAKIREELRQEKAEFEAWIQAGCPGLTHEMLSGLPSSAVSALDQRGVRVPGDGEAARQ